MKKLVSFIQEKMSKTKIPGLAILVLKDGEIFFMKGFGFRSVERNLPVTEKTLFYIGSVTKSFTAFAIMKLAEQGKISLNDPVDKYLDLKLEVDSVPVTIHHLLTHTSGIPALAYAEALIRGYFETSDVWLPISKPEDILDFIQDYENWIEAKPGEKFFYLNEGYVLLGLIISKVSNMSYEEFVEKEIFEPLDMKRSIFCDERVFSEKDIASHYILDKNGSLISKKPLLGVTADGGIVSCIEDLAKYIKLMIDRGKFEGKEILSEKSVEKMEKEYVRIPYELFGGESYGYGWMIYPRFFGRKLIGHGGSVLTHNTFVGYVPSERLGVVVLTNVAGYSPMYFGMYALALIMGEDPNRLPFLEYEEILNKLQGIYQTYKGTMTYFVKRKGDFLFLEYKDKYLEEALPLFFERQKENSYLFYTLSRGRKIEVEFKIEKDKIWLIYERYKMMKN
ncbi:MAG TPA: serine hydrolase [Thermotoga sp.]|nr:serine hydrolase [Thermotoga sp.]